MSFGVSLGSVFVRGLELWRKGMRLGVTDAMAFPQKRALKNLNSLAMGYLLVPIILSALLIHLTGLFFWFPFIGASLISVSLLTLLVCNYFRLYATGKILHYFLALSGLLINVYYYGTDFGIDFFILIMFVGAFTFSHDGAETSLLALLAGSAYLAAVYLGHTHTPIIAVSAGVGFHMLFSAITFIIIFSSLRMLQWENEIHTAAIQETNEMLHFQKEELQAQHENVKQLLQELSYKNSLITASLDYAKKLQQSILPSADDFRRNFPDLCLFFKPRDTVSGDFYWHYAFNNRVYFAVADCTGHGVPGALMSMLGSSILRQIVQSTLSDSPKLILKYLDINIQQLLNSSGQNHNDGMDIILCVYEPEKQRMFVSSTNRPYFLFRDGHLQEFRGARSSVGRNLGVLKRDFAEHELHLQDHDVLYFFTDGITDQFDRTDQRKFSLKRLREFFIANHHLPMKDQEMRLRSELDHWQGLTMQTDDMLLIGIRI